MRLAHPSPFEGAWKAKWIWHGRPALEMETATRPVLANPTDRVVLFRREIVLDAVPDQVPGRIWVDGRYVLVVNGEEVARGPVRAEPRTAHYDVVDLAPHLRSGTNVIAITARHFGQSTSWWIPVPPTYSLISYVPCMRPVALWYGMASKRPQLDVYPWYGVDCSAGARRCGLLAAGVFRCAGTPLGLARGRF